MGTCNIACQIHAVHFLTVSDDFTYMTIIRFGGTGTASAIYVDSRRASVRQLCEELHKAFPRWLRNNKPKFASIIVAGRVL